MINGEHDFSQWEPVSNWGTEADSQSQPAAEWDWQFTLIRGQESAESADDSGEINPIRSEKMARVEAVLLVSEGPLSTRKLSQLATLADAKEAKQFIEQLNEIYDHTRSSFRVERVAAGYQLMTRPVFAPWLDKLHKRQEGLKLSPPAMETLTIIAYRQPMTRADVEELRGVACSDMLKQLLERGLIRIAGEEDTLGRPYLYETTRSFLENFGLRSLADLPMASELRRKRA